MSVVMSAHNELPYVRRAVESIFQQTWSDFEFVIVDDASDDGTETYLRDVASDSDRVRLLVNETNRGLTASLNRALSEATGEYIVRLDADDRAYEDRIERQVEYMQNHPEIVAAGTWYEVVDSEGTVVNSVEPPTSTDAVRKALIKYNPICHPSIIIRREAIEAVSGYDERYPRAQDYDLWFRLLREGGIANVPNTLTQRRYTDDCISVFAEDEQLRCALRARIESIQRGQYPPWAVVYLLRPALKYALPKHLRQTVRNYLAQPR